MAEAGAPECTAPTEAVAYSAAARAVARRAAVVEVAVAIVVALTLPEDTVLPLVVGMEIPLMQGSLISLLEREELLVEVVAAVAVVAAAEVDVEAIIMMYSTLLDTVELAVV